VVGGEVDDEGVIRKICVVPKPYQQPHQPMFQPFSVSEATIRYTAQSDIVPVILTAYPPRLRPFRGSLPTLRWREMDSNFWFLVARPSNRHGTTVLKTAADLSGNRSSNPSSSSCESDANF
jgi:hypothetical protein